LSALASVFAFEKGMPMRSEAKERWDELCRKAAVEQDPEKLNLLNRQIDRLLKDEEDGLKRRKVG
jgi:hypothetical protein